ncbi:SusC/RagA family TonB-linked outer membrane protein, partial [Echinicola sediminis]
MIHKFYFETFRIREVLFCFLILGCGLLRPLTAEARNELKGEGTPAEFVTDPTEKISGKVVDENGEAMIGVSILVKGTTSGTVTDDQGNFSLDVNIGDVLVLSFIGYESQNVTIVDDSPLTIQMQMDAESVLNEVVVVGYGSQSKRSMTGAVANLKAEKLQEIPSSNLSSLLSGRMSGVYVQAPTGTPGVASNINIRSRGSMNGNPPVYVIDGVIRDKRAFDALDPTEIQEVSILKDAASAALYGSRSAGGVVLVATRTGSNSKTKINYTTNYSIEKQTNLPKMMSGVDIAKMGNTWVPKNSDWYRDQEFIDWMSTVNGGYGYDYIEDVYVDPTNKRHALNVSGGNENIQYYAGGTYFDQQGWLEPLKYNKFNLRASVTAKLNENLTAHVNLSQYSTEREKFWWPYDYGSDNLGDLWKKLQTWQYFYPHYIEGKPWNYGWLGNVGELINNSGYWRNRENVQNSLVSLKYDLPFVPGMSVKATYNYERYNNQLKNYQKKHLLWNIEGAEGNNYQNAKIADPESTVWSNGPSREYISSQAGNKNSYQFNLQVDYKRSFGKHNVDAFFAYEQAENDYTSIDGTRYDFPIIVKDQYFAS